MDFGVTPQGYHYVRENRGGDTTTVHRLSAVAEHGFDAVAGNDVHHKDDIKCMNSRENVEPIPKAEHARKHQNEEYGTRRYRDEDVLRKLYVEKEMTLHEVGDELDCSSETVRDRLDKHGIDRRNWSTKNPGSDYKDADTLRRLYVNEDLSTYDLADRFDVSKTTINRWLRKHDIKVREPNK